MNRIIASASLAALGAVSLHAASASGLTPIETAKPWSVSAALRGFYDSNYATRPSSVARDSFGFELAPSAKVNISKEQTYLGLGYDYHMKWFDDRRNDSADHSHLVNLTLNHAFTENHKLDIHDNFAVAQEPELFEPAGATTVPLRADGNNMRNAGGLSYTASWTPLISTVLAYDNTIYDYQQSGIGSYSSALDRLQHMVTANLRFHVQPSTIVLGGYQYGRTGYTSKDSLAFGPYVDPSIRDNNSHYGYLGVDHYFNPQLNGSIRAGVQYVDYSSRLLANRQNEASPYVDSSLSWNYTTGSTVSVGVRHEKIPTDIAFFAAGSPTLDQEATTVYGNVKHQITAMLSTGLLAQYQHSTFNGGAVNNKADDFVSLGINLAYQFNQFISAETGYAFDDLSSDLANRGFDRHRVFLGVRFTY